MLADKVRARRSNQCNATAWYPRRNLFKIALMVAFILNLCVVRGQHADADRDKTVQPADEIILTVDENTLIEAGAKKLEDGTLLIEDGTTWFDGTRWLQWTVAAGVVCIGTYAAVNFGIPAMVYNAATYYGGLVIDTTISYVATYGPSVISGIETYGPKVFQGAKYIVKEGGEIAIMFVKLRKEYYDI